MGQGKVRGAGTDPPVRDAAGTKRRGRRVYEFGRGPCRRTGVMLQEQSDGERGCTSSGGCRSFEAAAKQETESSQMAKLRFCGADEARTRDPRRDRPVF